MVPKLEHTKNIYLSHRFFAELDHPIRGADLIFHFFWYLTRYSVGAGRGLLIPTANSKQICASGTTGPCCAVSGLTDKRDSNRVVTYKDALTTTTSGSVGTIRSQALLFTGPLVRMDASRLPTRVTSGPEADGAGET